MPNKAIGSPAVNELAFINAVRQQKAVTASLKSGAMPCLPGAGGYADTSPAVNIVDGKQYSGAALLLLKKHQKDSRFPTAEYISDEQIDKAKSEIEAAKKAGYVQGVCECVAAIGDDYALGKKLLAEMNVNKNTAKKYANPETFKALENGVFSQKQEQKLEHRHKRSRKR